MDPQGRTVDGRLAWIAGRAHGVVAFAELLAAGISRDEIRGRVRRGALIREYRGVYRVGHAAPSTEARGDDFRRYTWGDVFEHPAQMLAELKARLA